MNEDLPPNSPVKIIPHFSTPSNYFEYIEKHQLNKLKVLELDMTQYDENTRYLDPVLYRTMHKIDYWTGYHSNRGLHK